MSAPGAVRVAEGTRDTWETPSALFELLDSEFRFTLDAAAEERNRKCERWLEGPCVAGLYKSEGYALDILPQLGPRRGCNCGLCADWMEHTVWLNPPYGKGLATWIEKCRQACDRGATVVALLPANTDTGWFSTLWGTASELRFLTGRVQFVGTTSSNPGGSVLTVFRPGPWFEGPLVRLWDWKDCGRPE